MADLDSSIDAVDALDSMSKLDMATKTCARAAQSHAPEVAQHVVRSLELRTVGNDASGQLMLWVLLDKLCKADQLFLEAFRPMLVSACERFAPPMGTPEFRSFETIVDGSFKLMYGGPVGALIMIKVKEYQKERAAVHAGASSSSAAAPTSATPAALGGGQKSALAVRGGGPGGGQLVERSTRAVGGFMAQNANNTRPEELRNQLSTRTRDSLQALKVSSAYAPVAPTNITVAIPERDADAPAGFVQALPANYHEDYKKKRLEKLRQITQNAKDELEKKRRKTEKGAVSGGGEGNTGGASSGVDYSDIKMPLEFERDEYGVRIGNYPEGVRFIRDSIRNCGGALELSLIEERIAQLVDPEAKAEFGNVRRFIHIHKPTFTVSTEKNRFIVRLTDDPPPDPNKPLSWESAECPFCTRIAKGRNLGRHCHNRKCVGIQLAMGLDANSSQELIGRSPIAQLAAAARDVMLRRRDDLDDDDVLWFADCINRAGEIKRFRFGSEKQFSPILRAIRVLRDRFLEGKGVASFSDVKINEDDRVFAHFFATLGANLKRLPIAWIETGDIIDMCSRFTGKVLGGPHPPPKPGDPRIGVGNSYPAFLFAESGSDEDDKTDEDEEAYSDDEGAQFEFAPPVTLMETMMVAGIERDTKKLNYRLRTAPPIPAATVVRSDGQQTHQDMARAVAKR